MQKIQNRWIKNVKVSSLLSFSKLIPFSPFYLTLLQGAWIFSDDGEVPLLHLLKKKYSFISISYEFFATGMEIA
jgi:hypothetical protein